MFALLLLVLPCDSEVVRLRLGNGSTRRIDASDAASLRAKAGLPKTEPLFLDGAPLKDGALTCKKGTVISVAPVQPERVPEEVRFDPYPALARRRTKKMKKFVATIKDVEERSHDIKTAEKICDEARVDSTFDQVYTREYSLIFGRREKHGVVCEAFGGDSEAEILVQKLGLEIVGCAITQKEATPTAAAIVAAAVTQFETMRDLQQRGPNWPFVVLVATDDGTGLEAYEVSEHLVQLVAEGIVDDSSDDLITTSVPVRVEGDLTTSFHPEWVYRPVPVIGQTSNFFTAAPSASASSKQVDAALRKVLQTSKQDPSKLLTDLTNVPFLVRLRSLMATRDFDTLCTVLKQRRAAPPTDRNRILLPRSFAPVIQLLTSKLR